MTENVKKIFEIIGVEPNEEFEIEDKNCFWKIDEELNLYYRQGHYDNGDDAYNSFNNSLIIDLIKNPKLVIKLQKEPKKIKKKLRDITEEEWNKWKDKNCSSGNCNKCFFDKVNCFGTYSNRSWFYNKDLFSNRFLDQEIEVEE